MKFYRIRHTLNVKEIGKYPQIKDVAYPSTYDSPKFIGSTWLSKIEFEPEVPKPLLESKANLTDLIENIGTIPLKILISGKLKTILEGNRDNGIQFFQCSVFQNGNEYPNYWYLNMYIINNEYIDYKNSKVIWRKKKQEGYGTIPTLVKIESKEHFYAEKAKAKVNLETFHVINISLQNVEEDFFMLRDIEGGAGFFVSEKLKKEIEDAGSTGIEFQPSGLSYNEWTAPGGERQRIYGKF